MRKLFCRLKNARQNLALGSYIVIYDVRAMSELFQIKRPIFILGSGRSGTTLLYNLLCGHPDVFWFSSLTNAFPAVPQLALFHRLSAFGRNPRMGVHDQHSHRLLYPSEGDAIYHRCGFVDTKRSHIDNVSDTMRQCFFHTVRWHQIMTGKKRFINKQTANTQRIAPLVDMFPDAYWIHIIRDPKAVVSSLLHVSWWPSVSIWWLGQTPKQWEASGKDPVVLCAEHWKHNVTEIISHKTLFGRRYIEVYYEELIRNPQKIMARVLRFCNLPVNTGLIASLPRRLPDRNNKWRKLLTKKQAASIAAITKSVGITRNYAA